jgi:polyhydroxybutyrate depolymerase
MEIAGPSTRRAPFWCVTLLFGLALGCAEGSTSQSGSGGNSGAAGVAGGSSSGAAGSAGSPGAAGTTGAAGSTGAAGAPSGAAGATGAAGSSGAAGSGGAPGAGGSPSSGGATGTAGSTGKGGATGTAGAAAGKGGSTGSAGASGDAVPSAGCSASATPPASGRYTIDVSGTEREYIIKIPTGYDPTHPYRLIFALHGRMYSAQTVADGGAPSMGGPYYGIEPQAGGSAIFVAGQALDTSWTNQSGRDIAYFDAMRTKFESQLCIDKSREFVVGFSMGAIMTIQMGCAQANIYRAIAPMSGSLNGNSCTGTDPIAYWGSHGTNDTTIAISNGRQVRDTFRTRNHCASTTTPGDPSGCVNYTGCDAGNPVTWCEFDGVHEPPPYSGTAIWNFFKQF